MYVFFTLSDEEKKLVIELPIRVAVKIAKADIEGDGEGATIKELSVIKKSLKRSVSYHKFADVVKATAEVAVNIDPLTVSIENVIDDASRVYEIIKKHYSKSEVASYREMILETGLSVAKAYREEGDNWDDDEDEKMFASLASKVSGFISSIIDRENHLDMNVSPEEDTILTDIAMAMK